MKKNIVAKIAVVSAILAGGLWVASPAIAPDNCVHIYIDYGVLDNDAKVKKCVSANREMTAVDVFNYAGIDVEGTEKYGNAVVCRVDGKPAADLPINIEGHETYVETCADMPPAFGYWAVFVKPYKNVNVPLDFATGWKWAETGADQVMLSPGDTIGLVFTANEENRFPND
jgi:hypothetical protein